MMIKQSTEKSLYQTRLGLCTAIGLFFLLSAAYTSPIRADQPTATPIGTANATATIPPNATPIPIRSGAQLQYGMIGLGNLHDSGSIARYIFFGLYGNLVSIGVFPAGGQSEAPTIELDAPDGSVAGSSNGISGGAPGAVIPAVTLPATGVYELYVQAADPQAAGAYTIRIANDWILRDLDGGTLTVNTLTVGHLAQEADRQTWHIMLSAGTKFYVSAQTAGNNVLDPVIDVVDPNGKRLSVAHDLSNANQAQTDPLTASITGLYAIRISAYVDASTGAYDLIVHTG